MDAEDENMLTSFLGSTEWDEKTELKFQKALDSIDKKYGHALKNLTDMQ